MYAPGFHQTEVARPAIIYRKCLSPIKGGTGISRRSKTAPSVPLGAA